MAYTIPLTIIALYGFITFSGACDLNAGIGETITIPLSSGTKLTDTDELEWKRDTKLIFKRREGKAKPGDLKDIDGAGSLKLRDLKSTSTGTYTATVFNSNGKFIKEMKTSLCVMDKPEVTFKCSSTTQVTFNCTVAKPQEVTFKWSHNGEIVGTDQTLAKDLKNLKKDHTFTCTVTDKVSKAIRSNSVNRIKCEVDSSSPFDLFGLGWVMVAILAGGGTFVLLLIIITVVCCCCRRRRNQMHLEEERELRLVPLTQQQQHHHHQQKQSHQAGPQHKHKAPTGTHPTSNSRPTQGDHGQATPQSRAQARGRLPQIPKDNEEEHPPPLPQPRKKGPRPPRQ